MADHALIVEQATRADATAHLAFTLDFDAFDEAIDNEVALFDTLGDALAGSGKALFAASGTRRPRAARRPRATRSILTARLVPVRARLLRSSG